MILDLCQEVHKDKTFIYKKSFSEFLKTFSVTRYIYVCTYIYEVDKFYVVYCKIICIS